MNESKTMKLVRNLLLAFALTLPLAGAMAQPQVPGAVTSSYATVPDPLSLSFGADGALYVGRDNSGSGGGNPDAVKIHRIGPGGSPVTEFGNSAIPDPDAVIVDRTGAISGIAGSVLVGGQTSPGVGAVWRVAPEGTVTTLWGASSLYNNTCGFAFDSQGRLLFTDGAQGRVYRSDGGTPTLLFNLGDAYFIATDAADRIVVSPANNPGRLVLYSASGVLSNANFASVRLASPLARGPGGFWTTDLYAITAGGNLVRVALDGTTTTVGADFNEIEGLTFGPDGALYASDFNGDRIWRIALPPPPVTFTSRTFTVGDEDSGPDWLAAADVNNDGRLDLISANYGFRWANPGEPGGWNNTLTVLTNDASGGFGSNTTLTVGFGPSAVVAADVNGDGQPDLISANETDNSLTVLTNNGHGGFGFRATLPVGSQPRGLVAADVNGDLALDLACVNAGGNSVSVLLNQGSGVFASPVTLPVGNQPLFLAASDVNGDGQPDLITANKADDSLTVLTNNGGGGFGFNATLPVGHFPNAVSAADFNRDARVDLVSVNWGAATITVLTNKGSGGFGLKATLGVGNYPSTVAVADFNGDGAADLICASTEANSLRVLTNNGSGVFGHDTTVAVGRIPNVFAADLNSDGKLDLACPNFRDGTVTVLLNTTAFTPANSRPTLTIERQADGVRVAWPSASPGWSLQQKPDVGAVNWLPSGHEGFGIADNGMNKSLTLPASHANRFFRLLHP